MAALSEAKGRQGTRLLGFCSLLGKELQSWWGTRRWWIQGLVWVLALNGLLFVGLFVLPGIMAAQGETPVDPMEIGGQLFFSLGMIAVSVGVIVISQGEIIDERQSGTASWILSKPVSRSAFILSKLAANALSILCVMILLPAMLAYVQLAIASGAGLDSLAFPGALLMTALHALFYLSLTIFLGVILENRGAILGISLGVLLGGLLLRNLPLVGFITPWILPDIAGALLTAPENLFLQPVIMTGVWSAAFTASALVAFQKVEL